MICSDHTACRSRATIRALSPRALARYCELGALSRRSGSCHERVSRTNSKLQGSLALVRRAGAWGPWPFQPGWNSCSDQLSEGQLHTGEDPQVLCCRNRLLGREVQFGRRAAWIFLPLGSWQYSCRTSFSLLVCPFSPGCGLSPQHTDKC